MNAVSKVSHIWDITVPWLTQASTTKGPKHQCDSLDNSLLVAMLLPYNQTLSPGVNTGAGSHWQL
jgi:hypothetical protein